MHAALRFSKVEVLFSGVLNPDPDMSALWRQECKSRKITQNPHRLTQNNARITPWITREILEPDGPAEPKPRTYMAESRQFGRIYTARSQRLEGINLTTQRHLT